MTEKKKSIRIDADMAARAETLFEEMGMSLSTAISVFIQQSLREGGMPFSISLNCSDRDAIHATTKSTVPSVMEQVGFDKVISNLNVIIQSRNYISENVHTIVDERINEILVDAEHHGELASTYAEREDAVDTLTKLIEDREDLLHELDGVLDACQAVAAEEGWVCYCQGLRDMLSLFIGNTEDVWHPVDREHEDEEDD